MFAIFKHSSFHESRVSFSPLYLRVIGIDSKKIYQPADTFSPLHDSRMIRGFTYCKRSHAVFLANLLRFM